MQTDELNTELPALLITTDAHVYLGRRGQYEQFPLGKQSEEARKNYQNIQQKLEQGFFEEQINKSLESYVTGTLPEVDGKAKSNIETVIRGVKSQGKGIAGVLITQLVAKAAVPSIDTRLHKGSRRSNYFSWKDGISLRSIDKDYITPTLNRKRLLNGNETGGSMMTRALSQNIPYTPAFPPDSLRGPEEEWLDTVAKMEVGDLNPEAALQIAIAELLRIQNSEEVATQKALATCNQLNELDKTKVALALQETIVGASHTSALHEAAVYAAVKSSEPKAPYEVEPLRAHRSADTKSGRNGDIEAFNGENLSLLLDAKAKQEVTEREKKRVFNQNADYAAFVVLTDTQKLDCGCRTLSLTDISDHFVVRPQEWLREYIRIVGSTEVKHATFRQKCTEHLEELSSKIANLQYNA